MPGPITHFISPGSDLAAQGRVHSNDDGATVYRIDNDYTDDVAYVRDANNNGVFDAGDQYSVVERQNAIQGTFEDYAPATVGLVSVPGTLLGPGGLIYNMVAIPASVVGSGIGSFIGGGLTEAGVLPDTNNYLANRPGAWTTYEDP